MNISSADCNMKLKIYKIQTIKIIIYRYGEYWIYDERFEFIEIFIILLTL